ncbi:hypothetical protein TRAPUB_5395 [Trametes pubescens]|uniref:Uncharacterized protein n=1 Tax=Trametes pubescens TaxID=154538 RepID=A0A1M2V8G2_TRAPU|nr:hypothetical protein TRAPUB_5395 [Trametes pubescens]
MSFSQTRLEDAAEQASVSLDVYRAYSKSATSGADATTQAEPVRETTIPGGARSDRVSRSPSCAFSKFREERHAISNGHGFPVYFPQRARTATTLDWSAVVLGSRISLIADDALVPAVTGWKTYRLKKEADAACVKTSTVELLLRDGAHARFCERRTRNQARRVGPGSVGNVSIVCASEHYEIDERPARAFYDMRPASRREVLFRHEECEVKVVRE